MDWHQATQYAKFNNARLPSGIEWQYAAYGGSDGSSRNVDNATCEYTVMYNIDGYGCGANGTMPVCSKPAGNTAQGLCDMMGNVLQWVQDKYTDTYQGSEYEGANSYRMIRGASFRNDGSKAWSINARYGEAPGARKAHIGFRLAK